VRFYSSLSLHLLVLLSSIACTPSIVGAPCSSDAFCPTGQVCVNSRCALQGGAGGGTGGGAGAGSAGGGSSSKESNCADLRDDDGDGLIDCKDPDCQGITCRVSAGPCDVDEVCNDKICPADGFAGSERTCRGSVGGCDVPEQCDAKSLACPEDVQKCEAGFVCDPVNQQCVAKRKSGDKCGSAVECQSSFCVGGICCETACAGACEACGAGKCEPARPGTDPKGKCAPSACGPSGQCDGDCQKVPCDKGFYCDAAGVPAKCMPLLGANTPCDADKQCESNNCQRLYLDQDGDGFGQNIDAIKRLCAPVANMSGLATNNADCCDSDPRAYPKATDFFSEPRKNCAGFDFNCDGQEEAQFVDQTECELSDFCSPRSNACGGTAPGWRTTGVPSCGAAADYVESCQPILCAGANLRCNVSVRRQQQQCR
jgi:hypothetical protein